MPRDTFDRQLADLRARVLALGGDVGALLDAVADGLVAGDADGLRAARGRLGPLRATAQAVEARAFTLISLQQPVAGDLRRIAGARAVARELERVADHGADLARAGRRLIGLPALALSPGVDAPLATARAMLGRALEAYAGLDVALAAEVWETDHALDAWYERFCRDVLEAAAGSPALIEPALVWLAFAHDLERLGDRVTNICERVAYIVTGDLAYTHRPGPGPMPPSRDEPPGPS